MPTPQAPSHPALAAHPPRFRLLDDFQARYLKFNGREPSTLEELACARADYEHRRRLAEIKIMAKKLALLDAFLPELAARGVSLAYRDIVTHDHGKTLRVGTVFVETSNRLLDALIALGFKEIARKDSFRDEQTVTIKHGRALLISLDVKKAAAPIDGSAS